MNIFSVREQCLLTATVYSVFEEFGNTLWGDFLLLILGVPKPDIFWGRPDGLCCNSFPFSTCCEKKTVPYSFNGNPPGERSSTAIP